MLSKYSEAVGMSELSLSDVDGQVDLVRRLVDMGIAVVVL